MSYQEQQEQEIEALEAIYSEHEIHVESRDYPNISLSIQLKSNQYDDPTDDDFEVSLGITFPETYPDTIPEISLNGIEDVFSEERIEKSVRKLRATAEENVGMVMVFAVVSALQDEIGELVEVKKRAKDEIHEIEKEKKEAESRKKFEGTVVTPESFRAWKERFDAERKAEIDAAERERLALLAGRLTGRQLFLRDATLNLSDVTIIGDDEDVEIDESLFDNEELEGLDLDSEEDDDEKHENSPNFPPKPSRRLVLIIMSYNGFSAAHLPSTLQVKSQFDSEWRRFSIPLSNGAVSYDGFRSLVEKLHHLESLPFTLCYTSVGGDLLPITNDDNLRKSFESARPLLRLLIKRRGESWEEKYGYGTDSDRNRWRGISSLIAQKPPKRSYSISNPEDFRQVSAIIDVDIVPEAHRRVRLCKHGQERPLGFYIRDGTSVRVTERGVVKVSGIFISRLVDGGLAESTGLLGVNDEVLEVNGIEVLGKTLDQVTDMMVANAHNLIITVKPANQRNTLSRGPSQQGTPQQQQSDPIARPMQAMNGSSDGSYHPRQHDDSDSGDSDR
ncbi:unnamed protein product [Caenorhabditis sp. 36 PRJEB53466]|nr:unnamed protein product [Caenorhabditis sp. 36 PRJEB53466]